MSAPLARDFTGAAVPAPPALMDGFGRTITYLRVSITDRCDLRCQYCMPEKMQFMPRRNLLSVDELVGITDSFIGRGIRTIRLTGGEPLTRRDFGEIARRLSARLGRGLDELTLTTNATRLAQHAADLAALGVRRINVSLDTFDADSFARITRGGDLSAVLAGIDAARRAGLSIRVNMVAMAGVNDHQLVPMLDWCAAHGFDLALIETMPMGAVDGALRSTTHVALDQFVAAATGGAALRPVDHHSPGPACYVRIGDWPVRVGLITPISANFCASCNRIRLTADGQVHGCLGHDSAINLAAAWREGGRDALDPLIDRLMLTKAERHVFKIGNDVFDSGTMRTMNVTGG